MASDKLITLEEAVRQLMELEGCSRMCARRILVEAMAAGELHAIAEMRGERKEIPAERWNEVLDRFPSEH